MAIYEYKVLDPSGKSQTGRIEATSASSIADSLRSKGYRIIYINERKGSSFRSTTSKNGQQAGALGGLGRISIRDLSIFTNQFGTMLNSGLSISRALEVMQKQTSNAKLNAVIQVLNDEVQKGQALSQGLAKFPTVFSPLYISMVQSGETSGNLGNSLITMSGFLQRDYEVRSKIRGAMTYPVAVLVFSVLIVIGLFIFVIPTFEGFLTQLGAPLPAPTKIVFGFADFLIHRGWLLLIIIVIIGALYIRWARTPQGRRTIDNIKLKAPVLSDLTIKSAMSRFSDTFATLFSGGIPIVNCLETVKGTIDNTIIAETVDHIIDNIKKGTSLSAALQQSGFFTPMVVEMSAIGEESGSLDKMLRKVAEFYDEEVNNAVNNITALINPILMVFVGGLIGGVLISLYLPIFTMASYVQ
ncbi:MAG: type II secretion system F family protein [Caldisericaceae bacterium]